MTTLKTAAKETTTCPNNYRKNIYKFTNFHLYLHFIIFTTFTIYTFTEKIIIYKESVRTPCTTKTIRPIIIPKLKLKGTKYKVCVALRILVPRENEKNRYMSVL